MKRPLALVVLLLLAPRICAGGKPATFGKVAAPAGTLLAYPRAAETISALKPGDAVFEGLFVAAPAGARGAVDADGLRVTLLGAWPDGAKPGPMESVVRALAPSKGTFALQLDRGRVVLTRTGKNEVKVALHVLDDMLTLELQEPGTEVAVELVSQWPAGAPFHKEPPKGHHPVTSLYLFVLKGAASARFGKEESLGTMRQRTLVHRNTAGGEVGPVVVRELPAWATEKMPAVPKESAGGVESVRKALAAGAFGAALKGQLGSADTPTRVAALLTAAAAGEYGLVLDALSGEKHAEARRAAVLALQHGSGRGAAEDARLYRMLVARGFRPAQAETVGTLLHGFDARTAAQPETLQTLIAYLNHDRIAVRELAAWQLSRLVSKGASITYDAGAPVAQRTAAQAAWRKLLSEKK